MIKNKKYQTPKKLIAGQKKRSISWEGFSRLRRKNKAKLPDIKVMGPFLF